MFVCVAFHLPVSFSWHLLVVGSTLLSGVTVCQEVSQHTHTPLHCCPPLSLSCHASQTSLLCGTQAVLLSNDDCWWYETLVRNKHRSADANSTARVRQSKQNNILYGWTFSLLGAAFTDWHFACVFACKKNSTGGLQIQTNWRISCRNICMKLMQPCFMQPLDQVVLNSWRTPNPDLTLLLPTQTC